MGNIYRIFRKELSGYLDSPSAYIFLIIFYVLGASMFFFVSAFFRNQVANMGGFFVFIPWLLLFFVPAIAMRMWAEEKKAGTDELLLTLPVKDYEVVIGKYLASLVLVILALALTFPIALTIVYFADSRTPVDWGPIWCGYLGSFLLGAALLALGAWASSLSRNQIISFIIACALGFALLLLGFPFIYQLLPGGELIARFSFYSHFVSLYRGVLDLADVVYYLTAIAFFLFLNIRSIESRKWA
jgi:ABC-2 type transport system permease protein